MLTKESLAHLLGLPGLSLSVGFASAASHFGMSEDMAVVTQGTQIVRVEHKTLLFSAIGTFFNRAYVV